MVSDRLLSSLAGVQILTLACGSALQQLRTMCQQRVSDVSRAISSCLVAILPLCSNSNVSALPREGLCNLKADSSTCSGADGRVERRQRQRQRRSITAYFAPHMNAVLPDKVWNVGTQQL